MLQFNQLLRDNKMSEWGIYINLENSFKDFLTDEINDDSFTVNGKTPSVRVGRKEDNDWILPLITIFFDSETAPRGYIGSNKRLDKQLIIIDIYATSESERLILADYVAKTINDGCTYYEYSQNEEDPYSPLTEEAGLINVDFISNTRVNLGQNIDKVDAHRHRISINVWISG
jgi:hypothetical protein